MKKIIYWFLVLFYFLSNFESIAQNKQNKYYKPIRFSFDGFTKIPMSSSETFDYDIGYGGTFGIVYTLNKASCTIYYKETQHRKNHSYNPNPFVTFDII